MSGADTLAGPMAPGPSLAGLLAIWPIAESFARYATVGDLINVSRASSTLRSSLHGRVLEYRYDKAVVKLRQGGVLSPAIGKHQTSDWAHLKSIALFACCSPTHTRGRETRPCMYCSRPICDACIVRDSFKHPNAKTFQNRLRYFCKDCWTEGRHSKSFRYPASNITNDDAQLEDRMGEDEARRDEADEFCHCTLKDNGWLCLDCKNEQNSSELILTKLSPAHSVECHGLDCKNLVQQDTPDKDRRRVCLWCERPLRRQWAGEDRYAWNLKTWEARARNAEDRSRDIMEYHRRRLEAHRMSRREMRGTTDPGDDKPIFVRHLDTVNYRNWMPEESIPDPESVWMSKNGYWRYHQRFLITMHKKCKHVKFTDINGVPIEAISALTQSGALTHSRLNKDAYLGYLRPGVSAIPEPGEPGHRTMCLTVLKARILDMFLTQTKTSVEIADILGSQFGLRLGSARLQEFIDFWLGKRDEASAPTTSGDPLSRDADEESGCKAMPSTDEEEESDESEDIEPDSGTEFGDEDRGNSQRSSNIDRTFEREDTQEVDVTEVADEASATGNDNSVLQTSSARDRENDEPPPYGM